MRRIFLTILIFSFAFSANCQQFIRQGAITYERKVNQWANIKGEFAEQFKKSLPEYRTDNFTLSFDSLKSVYKASQEIAKNFFNAPGVDNFVYSNYGTQQYIATKNIFEKTYLFNDAPANIRWKIKDDFREIAGFNCRRATAMLFDSVFVVAFYTDQITLPGGPEGFNGLPGTILGLIINRLHTTWYATKVDMENTTVLTAPTKGTPVTRESVAKQMQTLFANRNTDLQPLLWTILL